MPTTREFVAIASSPLDSPRRPLDRATLEIIRERNRFQWFVERLRDRAGRVDLSQLENALQTPPTWPGQHEQALVLLSLDPRDEALEILERTAAHTAAMDLSTFHKLAIIRWGE